MQFTYTLSDINPAIARLWEYGHQQRVWVLEGAMGAGKTTLVSALCRHLQSTDAASSPTFAIINEYALATPIQAGQEGDPPLRTIAHMDWYRLRDEEEAIQAGVESYILRKDCLCIIEWPTQAPELIRGLEHLIVHISAEDEDTRLVKASVASG